MADVNPQAAPQADLDGEEYQAEKARILAEGKKINKRLGNIRGLGMAVGFFFGAFFTGVAYYLLKFAYGKNFTVWVATHPAMPVVIAWLVLWVVLYQLVVAPVRKTSQEKMADLRRQMADLETRRPSGDAG